MTSYIRNPLTHVWLFLSVLTVISWWFGAGNEADSHRASAWITLVVVLIALIKTRFVIRHYMEVRFAPSWLRVTCDAWLIYLFGMISLFYWLNV